MTKISYPFDDSVVMQSQWSAMAQNWLKSGVIPGTGENLLVYADSTGMQVKVKSGAAWIKGHYFMSSSEEVLQIGAADPTNPRIDRVILRLSWINKVIDLAVLTGTPAANPTAPTLTQSTSVWEIGLALVRVNAQVSTISADKVSDDRYLLGRRLSVICVPYDIGLVVKNGVTQFTIPKWANNWKLLSAEAGLHTPSTSGAPTIQLYSLLQAQNLLSTAISIDANAYTSYSASTRSAVNPVYATLQTGERIRVDVTAAGTNAKGLELFLIFQEG